MFGISAGRGAYGRLLNLVFNRFIQPMEMCLLRFTFEIVDLRLEFLFPRTMVPQDCHNLVVTATPRRGSCLVLLECG